MMGVGTVIRRHMTFYGWVQGVGFRYRARHAADLYGCTGWVRNEWDGSVTMEIQGMEENIDRVILVIEAGRYVNMARCEQEAKAAIEAGILKAGSDAHELSMDVCTIVKGSVFEWALSGGKMEIRETMPRILQRYFAGIMM